MKTNRFLLAASLSLAMAFTFSCGTVENASEEGNFDSNGVSNSGGGGLSSSGGSNFGGNSSSSGISSSGVVGSSSSGTSSSGGNSSSSSVRTFVDDRDGKTYKLAEIGEQVWMAENLNYDVSDSHCYDDDPANCVKYGRLYNWATAMVLDESCNDGYFTCADQIQTPKHQGICPEGWHIPSNADWDKLLRYVDGTTGTSSPYRSSLAGRHLKAQTGWELCGPSGYYECKDTYGFSALPGGIDGASVGSGGSWWSASESVKTECVIACFHAYRLSMSYSWDGASCSDSNKIRPSSVRCIQS